MSREMNQREQQFKDAFDALLREYSVTMSIEESTKGYYTTSAISFFSYTQYDEDGNEKTPSIDWLTTYEDGK